MTRSSSAPGSAQLVLNLPLLYADPGDEVILAPQSYALYEAASQVMGATISAVPLDGLRFDVPTRSSRRSRAHQDRVALQPEQPHGHRSSPATSC